MLRAHVAGRVNSRIRSLQVVIGHNSVFLVVIDANRLQVHARDVGDAADPDQDFIGGERKFVVVADQFGDFFFSFLAHVQVSVLRWMPIPSRAIASERICAASRSSLPKHRIVLHDTDLRAQSAKCLRQFASERTTADDQQALGAFGRVENIFIRQIARRGYSGYRRKPPDARRSRSTRA